MDFLGINNFQECLKLLKNAEKIIGLKKQDDNNFE